MKTTAIDVSNKKFSRSFRGYRPAEVDDLMRDIASELETAARERARLEDQIDRMHSEVARYKEMEDTLNNAILLAQRSADEVLQAVEALIANTGHQEFALVSLSSSDHSHIQTLVETIMLRHPNLALSLPSLRIDSFSVGLAQALSRGRKTGFTFAPEAGSQRLRDVINKGVGEADLMRTAEAVFSQGWHKIKLYFMLGLPTETDEDVREIGRLVTELLAMGRRIAGVRTEINITASTFVPKPHTPFQWEPLIDREVLEERQALLRQSLPKRNIKFSWSDWDATWLEALFSRGDRRMRRVILRAWQLGARYDAWQEHFQPDLWHQAAQDCGVDADAFNHRRRGFEEHLPWEHIDVGVSRRFLQREYARSLTGELSRDCREECHSCGILAAYASELDQARGQMSAERPWGCP